MENKKVVTNLNQVVSTDATSPTGTCKVTGNSLSTKKLYSEKDISDYLRNFLRKALSGDTLSDTPWGEEVNKQLYVAIFALSDFDKWIKSTTRRNT